MISITKMHGTMNIKKIELIKLAASTTLQGQVCNHRNLLLSRRHRLYPEVEPQLRVGARFSLSSLWFNPR